MDSIRRRSIGQILKFGQPNKILFFQTKADHPRMCVIYARYDLDLDPMIFILDLDLDVLKMYLRNKIKFTGHCIRKISYSPNRKDIQKDRCN